jgi:hypothetical protein
MIFEKWSMNISKMFKIFQKIALDFRKLVHDFQKIFMNIGDQRAPLAMLTTPC